MLICGLFAQMQRKKMNKEMLMLLEVFFLNTKKNASPKEILLKLTYKVKANQLNYNSCIMLFKKQ